MKRRQQIQRQRTQRHRQSTVDDGGLITTVTAVADGDDIIAAAPQDDHAAENGTTFADDVDRIKPDISEGDKLFEAAGGNATQSAPTSLDNYDFEKAKFRYDYDIDDGGGGDGNNNNAAAEMQALRRGSIIMPSGGGSNDNTFNKRCLPEDTFSFVIYSPLRSRPFFLASMVFSLQIAIFVILAVDIIDISNVQNPFMWPANVETPVRIIEALAIVIAIITQDDVRKAVNLLREGFDKVCSSQVVEGFWFVLTLAWLVHVLTFVFLMLIITLGFAQGISWSMYVEVGT